MKQVYFRIERETQKQGYWCIGKRLKKKIGNWMEEQPLVRGKKIKKIKTKFITSKYF